jgi:hypothetical protein
LRPGRFPVQHCLPDMALACDDPLPVKFTPSAPVGS